MATKQNMPREKPQDRQKHAACWGRDLSWYRESARVSGCGPSPERSAAEIEDAVRRLPEFTIDELRQIPVMRSGTRLREGAVYVDLSDPQRQQLIGDGAFVAGDDNLYVPKSEVPYALWSRLSCALEPGTVDTVSRR